MVSKPETNLPLSKSAQGFQSMGKKDAPSQSEELSVHSSHPDIEVDTDVSLESEHGRMKKTANFDFETHDFADVDSGIGSLPEYTQTPTEFYRLTNISKKLYSLPPREHL